MRKPDFFIVGGPKCGTSAMHSYLSPHPDVFMPQLKEPHFFGGDLKTATNTRSLDWYLSLFSGARNERRVGEASPSYIFSTTAAHEIWRFNSESRVIIMIRNPVDMIYSLYYQRLYAGYEKADSFEDALSSADSDLDVFRSRAERRIGIRLPPYLDIPRFSSQIERYLDVFGTDRVHTIVFDDLRKDTAGVYRRVLEFLEVDETYVPVFAVVNPNKRVRNRVVKRIADDRKVKAVAVRVVPRSWLRTLNRLNMEFFERPPMDSGLRLRLREEFAPEVRKVSELLGRDLTYWVES